MPDSSDVDPHDWVTLWQSELSALAVDRECHEAVAAFATAWAAAVARHDGAATGHDRPAGRAGPDAAAWPAPPVAPLDARDGELASLRHRVAELERRIAGA
jgi:hypothetical protein